ncbi:hypothetical protein [Actinophytocola sp.]|uniref:hypothetical protein n=1 Tax=Actinophytocola sp. TaxID=1872138 RepID=UPI002D359BC6|nr:hypothetical protein [Actinophytocola sp.]HYQ67717.1 hypothetical protein [Actinophytocola sp.]
MLTKFWEAAGGKLADRWFGLAVPALLFWLGGVVAWGGVSTVDSLAARGLVLAGGLAVVGGSAVVVGRLTEPMLHVVEGYWPLWALRLWRPGAPVGDARFQELHGRIAAGDPSLAPVDFAEYLRLDRRLRREPAVPYRRMPTRVGNILRTAESLPFDKYGLDAVVVWPRLWLLLPDTARAELSAARQAMTGAVGAGLWGLSFVGFGVFALWAVPVGLAVFGLALWGWLPGRARAFGDLLEAAFDLYRVRLYEQLRWPLPANPAEEREIGLAVTRYLWRGSDAAEPTFEPPVR